MKKSLYFIGTLALLLAPVLGFSSQVMVEDHEHSVEVCSEKSNTVCAHLGFKWGPLSTSQKGQFIVHALTNTNSTITNLSVDLWMEMEGQGHGSSPVTLTQVRPNIYKVTEAYFIMPGEWLVKLAFDLDGVKHTIDIPVNIVE